MRWFEHKYTRYYGKGKHCKKVIYLQKSDLKTLWFSLQTDVRTGIVHFLKTLHFNPPLLLSIKLPVSEAVPPVPPPHLTLQINSIISSSSVVQALLKSLWAQVVGWQAFDLPLKMKPPKTRAPRPTPQPQRDPFCAWFSHHYPTVSRTVRRAAGQALAPRSCSAGEEPLGSQRRGHMRSGSVACCWASA